MALGAGNQLLADCRVLAALEAVDHVLAAAQAQFHVVELLAGQFSRAVSAGDGVAVEAKDVVVRLFLLAVVNVAPDVERSMAIALSHQCVELRQVNAGGGIRIPHGNALAALYPAGGPCVLLGVVVEGGEVGGGGAVAAIVKEGDQVVLKAVGEVLPAEDAQVDAGEQQGNGVAGERGAEHAEGIVSRQRLGRLAIGGDDQRGVVFNADLADGRPTLNGEGAIDPDDDVLIFGVVKIDPAKGVGRLLRGERGCQGKHGGSGKRPPRDEATHELGITEAAGAQELRGSVRILCGFCAVSVGNLYGNLAPRC